MGTRLPISELRWRTKCTEAVMGIPPNAKRML